MEEVVADGPRCSLQGLVRTPLPRLSALPICLKQAVPRTEVVLHAEGGSPAPSQKGGPSTPPARPWEGGGAAAVERGAFVLLTHLSRQLVRGGGGPGALWAGCFPHHGASPSLTTRAVGLEEGALESFKVIALSSQDPGFPDSFSYLPKNLILAVGGPKVPRDFCLAQTSLKTPGST